MRAATDPVGPRNDEAIRDACHWARQTICAWGLHGAHMDRGPTPGRLTKVVGWMAAGVGIGQGTPDLPPRKIRLCNSRDFP